MTNRTDNFNRADSTTSLGTPSDSGSAWVTYQSTLGILSNTAYDVAHSVYGVAGLQSSISDCAVQVKCSAQGNMSCAARIADGSNFLTGGGDGSGNLSIYKIVAAAFTQLASGTATQAAGDVFKFTVNGTALELFLNGVSKLTASSNVGQTNTIHGIFDFLSAAARFDDFSITALAGGGVSVTPGSGALTLTGQAPSISASQNHYVIAGSGALTLTGYAPQALVNYIVRPGAGALTITGRAPTVSITANTTFQPGSGALSLTGFAPSVVKTTNNWVQPGSAVLTLTGYAPSITITAQSPVVVPGSAALILSAFAPIVVNSGQVAAQFGGGKRAKRRKQDVYSLVYKGETLIFASMDALYNWFLRLDERAVEDVKKSRARRSANTQARRSESKDRRAEAFHPVS